MIKFNLRETALAGLIAAVYAVLGLFFAPISFAVYQIRVAEALTVLPFLTRAAIPGLFIGCALANIFGSQGWPDIVFGSLLTLIAAILTRMTRRLSRKRLNWFGAGLPVAILWLGGLVLLNQEGIVWLSLLGCLASIPFGVIAVRLWLHAVPNQPFALASGLISLAWLAIAVGVSEWSGGDRWVVIVGALAMIVAWVMTLVLTLLWVRKENLNILLAPLPPVLVNAFGVPLYLAPLYGLDYWFSVQMVGVGQLIACYLLGLPLLRLMQRQSLMQRLAPEA